MSAWMAGLGAGLQSAGNSAMQMLAERERRKREDALLAKQARLQDFNMGLELEKLGYEDVSVADEGLGKLRSAAEASPALMDMGGYALPMQDIYGVMAKKQEERIAGAKDVPMYSGETRKMVLNPNKTPEAIAMQRLLAQQDALDARQNANSAAAQAREDAKLAAAQGREDAKYNRSNRAAWAYIYGPGGPLEGREEYNPDFPYQGLAERYKQQMLYENRIDVAKTPRTSFSTSTRVGGGGGTGASGLDAGQRARLSAGETNLRNAEDEYQRVLANRPLEDPYLDEDQNLARVRQWAAGDSTFAANRAKRMQDELNAIRTEFNINPAKPGVPQIPAPSRGSGFNLFGSTGLGGGPQNPLLVQAQDAIAKIQASSLPAEEKARRIAIIRQRMGGR